VLRRFRLASAPPIADVLVITALIFSYAFQCTAAIRGASFWRSERRGLESAYAWIAHNTSYGATLVAFRDPLLYLYTGRHAEGLHINVDSADTSRLLGIVNFARRRGHSFVLIGPQDPEFNRELTRTSLSAAFESDSACRRVYSADAADVYAVSAPPRCGSTQSR
jgi:hypothetical protein